MNPKRILVVRFRAIGDCVMAAWPVTAIRHRYPDAQIVWAVESQCASVIDRAQMVQKAVKFPRDRWKKHRWDPKTWREQMAHYMRLRSYGFDLGIDFHGHSKTALCLRLAKPAQRIAVQATDAFARQLNPVVKIDDQGLHTVERHLKAIQTLDRFEMPSRPMMPSIVPVENLPTGPYVSIMTGASSLEKLYPHEKLQLVARDLLSQGIQVVSIGGPTDLKLEVPGVTEFVGELSLAKSMSVVAQSAVHLASDTGTGHMASAYGVPVVSLFGAMGPSYEKFRPFGDDVEVLLGANRARDIQENLVLEKIKYLLDRKLH